MSEAMVMLRIGNGYHVFIFMYIHVVECLFSDGLRLCDIRTLTGHVVNRGDLIVANDVINADGVVVIELFAINISYNRTAIATAGRWDSKCARRRDSLS